MSRFFNRSFARFTAGFFVLVFIGILGAITAGYFGDRAEDNTAAVVISDVGE